MFRDGLRNKYGTLAMIERAEEIYSEMSLVDVCRVADEFIDSLPEDHPKFTLKRRSKVFCCKSAIYGKLKRYEII